MPAAERATAEGDLGRTPLAHLLVYAIDRRLTGALFLTEPSGVEHVIRLARGAPVKVRPGDGFARLGELLLEEEVITPRTLEGALATKGGLLGDVLLLSGHVDSATVEWLVEVQLVRRLVRLFDLPPETTYRYEDGHDALADWGGDPPRVDPLAILWAGVREHGERSTRLRPTLERLAKATLRVHAALPAGRFGFRAAERAAIARLQQGELTLEALLGSGVAPAPTLRRLVYALVITRCLDLGGAAQPVGLDEPGAQPAAGGASQALARVQLRSTMHRMGAAAPDPAGDGERAVTVPRTRRKSPSTRPSSPPDEPAARRDSAATGADAAGPDAAQEAEEALPPSSLRDLAPRSLRWLDRAREGDTAGRAGPPQDSAGAPPSSSAGAPPSSSAGAPPSSSAGAPSSSRSGVPSSSGVREQPAGLDERGEEAERAVGDAKGPPARRFKR